MESFHFDSPQSYRNYNQSAQSRGLLSSGWRPLNRQFDWEHFAYLVSNDFWELNQKTMGALSDVADALGRNHYAWWANILNVFSENTRYNMEEFWDYITPNPPFPDYRYKDILSTETPVVQSVSRDRIPIEFVLNRLQEIVVFKILALLGKPNVITQYYLDRYFYYPINRFPETTPSAKPEQPGNPQKDFWDRLETLGTIYVCWQDAQVWLQIENLGRGKRRYTLIANEIAPLVNKSTYNLAVMLSGYQSRVGQVQSHFPIRTFPADIQGFTDTVQQAILDETQLAVLVHGEPGTGKTAWTQAVAKEILMPLGYVIFILDHDAVENFVPPTYLEKICLIINEADNLAQDRSVTANQTNNNKTEHILSLLDGTLYQSVIDEDGIQLQQRLVVMMTCNTTERLDPAMLRKGRVDLMHHFIHRFV
ncbi:AAA family ATPase [Roseofilum casamattae]|uniref:AAA family ATPase n=1 Tax=Roseofilum casamattae BLCC-M143 TaxID=3022442 RepID=A0ABT7BRN9_9CYAN|nr:AAA family ATPase [Roseofilum casamattae]MDJ1181863.1 AAA family ATPase [Roseofilum casamattae BLCC-M143]